MPTDFSRFINPNNGALYAFVEAPGAMLQTLVPVGATWGTKEDGTQKTVGEFVLHKVFSLDGSKVLVLLAAMEAPAYRTEGVNERDLAEWAQFMPLYGFPVDAWLDLSQYSDRINSQEYSQNIGS